MLWDLQSVLPSTCINIFMLLKHGDEQNLKMAFFFMKEVLPRNINLGIASQLLDSGFCKKEKLSVK